MLKRIRALVGKLTPGVSADAKPVVPAKPARATKSGTKSVTGKADEPPIPKRSIDPRRFAGRKGAGAWVLHVPDPTHACDFAREHSGKRFPAADALPIPGPGCGRTDCACMYHAEPDTRSKARREASERREEVRFEVKKVDRRKKSGRRVEDAWDRKRV